MFFARPKRHRFKMPETELATPQRQQRDMYIVIV